MNLQEFKFPKVSQVDMAFSTQKTIPELLKEAQIRGFDKHGNPYCKLFSKLFFEGGTLNYKKDLPDQFRKDAASYMVSFMKSFEPKHEHKEAICAMLLSELVEME